MVSASDESVQRLTDFTFRGEVINGGFGLLLDGSEVSLTVLLYRMTDSFLSF